MHDDILCVIMSMATEKETKLNKHRTTRGPSKRVIEATKLNAETRDPPSQDPRDHREQPLRHIVTPKHFGANIDDAVSQREW